jgi:hypothetical protein
VIYQNVLQLHGGNINPTRIGGQGKAKHMFIDLFH